MTRETKLGLAVAGTFLCLVGTVTAIKHFAPGMMPASGTPEPRTVASAAPAAALTQPPVESAPKSAEPEPIPPATPVAPPQDPPPMPEGPPASPMPPAPGGPPAGPVQPGMSLDPSDPASIKIEVPPPAPGPMSAPNNPEAHSPVPPLVVQPVPHAPLPAHQPRGGHGPSRGAFAFGMVGGGPGATIDEGEDGGHGPAPAPLPPMTALEPVRPRVDPKRDPKEPNPIRRVADNEPTPMPPAPMPEVVPVPVPAPKIEPTPKIEPAPKIEPTPKIEHAPKIEPLPRVEPVPGRLPDEPPAPPGPPSAPTPKIEIRVPKNPDPAPKGLGGPDGPLPSSDLTPPPPITPRSPMHTPEPGPMPTPTNPTPAPAPMNSPDRVIIPVPTPGPESVPVPPPGPGPIHAPEPDAFHRPGSPAPKVELVRPVPGAPEPKDPRSPPAPTPMSPSSPTPGPNNAVRPVSLSEPKADAYDEDVHLVQPGDTFGSVSRRYYGDETYASALQMYNRSYPGGAENPGSPTGLQSGQYLRVPPIRILEKRFASVVPNRPLRPAEGPAPGPAPPVAVGGQPSPVAVAPASAYPVYTVSDNGETLREIARHTLGYGEYWRRIWDLNPSINPGERIPGGTRLRLPPEARVQN